MRNTPDQDRGLSPAEMLLGRRLRDLFPGTKPMPHIRNYKEEVGRLESARLGTQGIKPVERLVRGTKELPLWSSVIM